MTLEELRTKLDAAKAGTDIVQVVFDYSSYMNYGSKIYPLALWDLDNVSGVNNIASDGEKLMTINCWCINEVEPEADVVNRHTAWDTIETAFKAYLLQVNGDPQLTIENIRAMPYEYFPAGLLSLEREMAVRYSVELKLWC